MERVYLRLYWLLFDERALFWRQINILYCSFKSYQIEIGAQGKGYRVDNLDIKGLLEQDGLCCYRFVADFILLQRQHTLRQLG
jgi:hypothetical protein